jgi:hypothetical protein
MDKFLDEAHKKSVSDGIRRYNKEKRLSKAEQALEAMVKELIAEFVLPFM